MIFPTINQLEGMGCGPACICIISKYYGIDLSYTFVRENCHITHDGVSLLGLSEASEKIGFHSIAIKSSWDKLWRGLSIKQI